MPRGSDRREIEEKKKKTRNGRRTREERERTRKRRQRKRNKAGYTANPSCGRVGRGGNACFHTF